jgi:hypothetical protein
MDNKKKWMAGITAISLIMIFLLFFVLLSGEKDKGGRPETATDTEAEKADSRLEDTTVENDAADRQKSANRENPKETAENAVVDQNGNTKTITKTTGSNTPKASVQVKKDSKSSNTNSTTSKSSSGSKSSGSSSKPSNPAPKPSPKPQPKPQPKPKPAPKPQPQPTPTYLSASEAHDILSGAGVFKKSGNEYNMFDSWGLYMITVTVGSDHVKEVFFDGTLYYTYKNDTLERLIEDFGEEEGRRQYEFQQQMIRKIEAGIRAAANAVYGSGTSKANSLYSEILQGGKSKTGYYREF